MFLIFLLAIIFSIFSTAVMSYIAMTAPIGPWIETTLVLLGLLILSFFKNRYADQRSSALGLLTAAGGIGGILATACAFSVPTLFFIDSEIFNNLLITPFYFVGNIALISLAAGSFGFLLAHCWEDMFIESKGLSFPIGELIYKLISVQDKARKSIQLASGFVFAQLLFLIQKISGILPKNLILTYPFKISVFSIPLLSIPLIELPMFISIGFITGHVIAIPLLAGIIVKLLVIQPLYLLYPTVLEPISKAISYFFLDVSSQNAILYNFSLNDFLFAFCSGLVIQGIIHSFLKLGSKMAVSTFKRDTLFSFPGHIGVLKEFNFLKDIQFFSLSSLLCVFVLLFNVILLLYAGFSVLSAIYLLLATAICIYQLLYIAGRIGLAPLGRFATFVMVPGIMLFKYSAKQVTLVGIFVEVACGVACDVLFGRKMARLARIDRKSICIYQALGLIVSTISVGIVFWFLITKFGLGVGGTLPATKAAGRALFLTVQKFDVTALIIGIIFGYLFSFMGINPALALGGLLMPMNMSLMLVAGGLLSFLSNDKESWHPLLSGIFASSALWIILNTILAK